MKYRITFKLEGGGDHKVSAAFGENILALAIKAGVAIDAPCSGNGTCGKCRLRLISGIVDVDKNGHICDEDFEDGWRLACQSRVAGDAVLLVPAEAGAFKNGIQTADLSSPQETAMYEEAMRQIFSASLSEGTAGAAAGDFGLAIDIGTTTVTAALIELDTGRIAAKASAGNGQIRYGADVINRIIQSSKPGGREKLRRAICEDTLVPMIHTLCREGNVAAEKIIRCVVAGNTTMEHLFVGENAESIRLEPFVPAFLELHGKTAADVRLPINPKAKMIFAPNVGSYVGGDITAGALATMIWNSEDLMLFIDLGTNGELVFGNSDFLLCCACSAGPAFEGGDISCGMRATHGAIESCTIDKETMAPTYEIIGKAGTKPAGFCGSGLIDIISELFRCGIISPNGKFVREGARVRRDDYTCSYIVAFADEAEHGRDIEITEIDIDNFIRAKGAIFSAIRSMLNSLDMTAQCIDHILIAGGIGSGINIENAIHIGMLPKIELSKYRYIGNSSLMGACAMLLSDGATEKVFEIGRNMTYLELSTHPGYMDEFVAACFLPHTDARLFDEE
ncbi:MAG: ASKHA domain-containing protein [Oscillospiraceae bacterium]